MIALVIAVLITVPTVGVADETVRVTGQAKEVKLDSMHVQVVPTEKGVFIVIGELVSDQPATVMLLEEARPVQIRVAGDWRTMVVHRKLEEALTATTQRLANTP